VFVLIVTEPTTEPILEVTADTSAAVNPLAVETVTVTLPFMIATLEPNSVANVNSAALVIFKAPVYTLLEARIAEISS